MTTVDPYAALNGTSSSSSSTSSSSTSSSSDAGSADRFLKLLVAQMENQDPMNPMDNAQITSQMAQINTVTGIQTLNTTVQGLNTQFMQLQALQGAALVGREVTVAGNGLEVADGKAQAGFDLSATADTVKVEVLDKSGRVVDTMQLGAMESGRHDFEWSAPTGTADGTAYTFRVTAKAGTSTVTSTALMRDTVDAVNADGSTLTLDLARSGSVSYSDVKAFN